MYRILFIFLELSYGVHTCSDPCTQTQIIIQQKCLFKFNFQLKLMVKCMVFLFSYFHSRRCHCAPRCSSCQNRARFSSLIVRSMAVLLYPFDSSIDRVFHNSFQLDIRFGKPSCPGGMQGVSTPCLAENGLGTEVLITFPCFLLFSVFRNGSANNSGPILWKRISDFSAETKIVLKYHSVKCLLTDAAAISAGLVPLPALAVSPVHRHDAQLVQTCTRDRPVSGEAGCRHSGADICRIALHDSV